MWPKLKGAAPGRSSAFFENMLVKQCDYLVHFGHGVLHFGHRHGASMLVITFAVDCSMLHGCPHVGHGFACGHGCAHAGHLTHPGFTQLEHVPANAGTANTAATANTNTNATIFLIVIPPFGYDYH